MKKTLIHCCTLLAFACSLPSYAEDAVGAWTGVVDNLRFNITISKGADGKLTGTFASPDQSTQTIQIDKLEATPSQLDFAISRFKVSYQGKWDESKKAWVGLFTQGTSEPLNLVRLDEKEKAAQIPKRPQEEAIAKSSPNYTNTEVSFNNTKSNIQFAATMTVPQGKGPFPAVVLVHGSGRNTRDEEKFGHKVFYVLADHLAKQGIAVLRYDKRGVAGSKGNYATATTFDFADDAQAAVDYLKTRTDVNQKKIGIVGHSEGGTIAPIVAARDSKLGFIVLMAGTGIRGDQLLLEQSKLISRADGAPEEKIEAEDKIDRETYAILTSNTSDEAKTKQLTELMGKLEANGSIPKGAGASQLESLNRPWLREFVKYDPATALNKVKQPVLAVNGELDLQVPAKLNLDAIKAALKHNKNVTIEALPKINHAFQTAVNGSPREYGKIEETFAPIALNSISNWILKQ